VSKVSRLCSVSVFIQPVKASSDPAEPSDLVATSVELEALAVAVSSRTVPRAARIADEPAVRVRILLGHHQSVIGSLRAGDSSLRGWGWVPHSR